MAKILIVEDDNNLREIYGARLEAEGYQIVGASDGEEALAIAVRERPDLIISDVMMPKISGFDMLDILRSTPETKDVKVIVMTALSQDEDRRRGEQLGADKYVVKSQVTLDDVVGMVEEIIATIPSGPEAQPPVQTPPQTPNQEVSTAAPPQPAPATAAPPTAQPVAMADEKELVKEVENFVATSPLMNGVAPSSLSDQIVISPGDPSQVAQIDNPTNLTSQALPTNQAPTPQENSAPTPQNPSASPETIANNDATS